MKNAILIITIIFGRLFHVNAQTIQNKKIEDFIYNHEISYNQKVNIIYRDDIDSLIKILERKLPQNLEIDLEYRNFEA